MMALFLFLNEQRRCRLWSKSLFSGSFLFMKNAAQYFNWIPFAQAPVFMIFLRQLICAENIGILQTLDHWRLRQASWFFYGNPIRDWALLTWFVLAYEFFNLERSSQIIIRKPLGKVNPLLKIDYQQHDLPQVWVFKWYVPVTIHILPLFQV